MARIFKVPFATQGDKETVPVPVQGDGSVSITQGFSFDYEREYDDPLAKDIKREVMNGLLHDITEAVGDIQDTGIAKWSADAAPYPEGAVVWHANNAWRSTVGNNSAAPTEGENWSAVIADTVSQSEAQEGTATTRREWTAQRVRQATTGWWGGIRANDLPLQSSIPQIPSADNVQEALAALAPRSADFATEATLTSADNVIVMTGIVAALELEVGDVIQIIGGGGNDGRLHTVEVITDADTIVVNYEHCGSRGDGPLKLVDYTGALTVRRVVKWHSAADGLGQAWVDVTSFRPASMGTNVLNSTNRKILVSLLSVSYSGSIRFLTAVVNGIEINRSVLPSTNDSRNAGILFPAHEGENYAYGSATGTSVSVLEWRERR